MFGCLFLSDLRFRFDLIAQSCCPFHPLPRYSLFASHGEADGQLTWQAAVPALGYAVARCPQDQLFHLTGCQITPCLLVKSADQLVFSIITFHIIGMPASPGACC